MYSAEFMSINVTHKWDPGIIALAINFTLIISSNKVMNVMSECSASSHEVAVGYKKSLYSTLAVLCTASSVYTVKYSNPQLPTKTALQTWKLCEIQ